MEKPRAVCLGAGIQLLLNFPHSALSLSTAFLQVIITSVLLRLVVFLASWLLVCELFFGVFFSMYFVLRLLFVQSILLLTGIFLLTGVWGH